MSRVTEHTKEVWIVSPTGTCRVKFLRICGERETENQRHLITVGAHLHLAPANQGSRTSHRGAERMEQPEGMEGSCGMHTSGHDMAIVCMGSQKQELQAQDMCKIKPIKTPARLGAEPLRLHS